MAEISVINNYFSIRLLRNYAVEHGAETGIEQILENFKQNKENSQCSEVPSPRRIGIELQEVFGDEIESSRKVERNKKIRVYRNLLCKSFAPTNISKETTIYHGWILQNSCEDEGRLSFSKVTNISVNDTRYTLDVEFDLFRKTLVVHGTNSIEVNEQDIGIPSSEIYYSNVSFLLYLLSRLRLCFGFKQGPKEETVVRTENDSLCLNVLIGGTSIQSSNVIAKKCKVFVCVGKSMTQGNYCCECSLVKKRLQHRKSDYQSIKNTKNCLLGREELKTKIDLLEKEKRNAIKRVGYWQNKFASEGVQLEKSDDEDLQTIFDTIDKSKVPEGFELLIAQQKQALVAKESSGRRWHPK